MATGYPALRRKTLTAGPDVADEEVIAGVEDLQFQLGVDTNGDSDADLFVNPGAVPAGARPVSVRLWLRVRAQERDAAFGRQRDRGLCGPRIRHASRTRTGDCWYRRPCRSGTPDREPQPIACDAIRARPPRRQAGIVLAIALLLLVVLTLLGTTGLVTAALELRMAANAQYQARAFEAAEFGIEQAMHSPGLATSITYANPTVVPASGARPRSPARRPTRTPIACTTTRARTRSPARRTADRPQGLSLRRRVDRHLGPGRDRHARAGLLRARPGGPARDPHAAGLRAGTATIRPSTSPGARSGCRKMPNDMTGARLDRRATAACRATLRRGGVHAHGSRGGACDRGAPGQRRGPELSRPGACARTARTPAPRCSHSPRPRRVSTRSCNAYAAVLDDSRETSCGASQPQISRRRRARRLLGRGDVLGRDAAGRRLRRPWPAGRRTADDRCRVLRLSSTGDRSASRADGTANDEECWSR